MSFCEIPQAIHNLKMRVRLAILVSVAFLAMGSIAVVGAVNNKRLADCVTATYQSITRPLAAVAGARGEFNAMRTALYDLTHDFNTSEQNDAFRQEVLKNLAAYESDILLYRTILHEHGTGDPYEQEAVDYLYSQLKPLALYVENIARVGVQAGRGADAVLMLRGEFLETADDISLDLAALTQILEAQTKEANVYADHLRQYNDRLSLAISVLGALFLFIIASVIVKSITMPMKEMSRAARRFSRGDLDLQLEYKAKDEIGFLADSFRAAAHDLGVYLKEKEEAERAAYEADMSKCRAEAATEAIVSSISYASKIQNNLRPADDLFPTAFSDHHIIWEPRDIVGGDMYWLKNFAEGSILCVCDCTGHGTPGALLTMLVVSALEAAVAEGEYTDPAHLMWHLDQRLAGILHARGGAGREAVLDFSDGCDIAIVFADVDGSLRLASSGIPVFICDGREVVRIRGQRLSIGEGGVRGPEDVRVANIAPNPLHKFYIASDGLFDQIGGPNARPFGYRVFTDTIMKNHRESQREIAEKIWRAFEAYRGGEDRRDDVELISFQPRVHGGEI